MKNQISFRNAITALSNELHKTESGTMAIFAFTLLKTTVRRALHSFIIIFLAAFTFSTANAQDTSKKVVKLLPKGFHISTYIGGAGGSVYANTNDPGKLVFKGSTIHFMMHVGYEKNNWALGLAVGFNSLGINSLSVNGSSYPTKPSSSIDNSLTGFFVKRTFMPVGIFVCLEGGMGKFSISDSDGNTLGETGIGLAWNIKAGKEFLLGKKKHFGLGGYANLSGIKCHDKAPYSADTYSYLAPGLGISMTYHW